MASYNYIATTGTVVPDTADLQATIEAEYKAVFGADLIVTPDTPQGMLIAAETVARDAMVRNNAALANQINPNLAGGPFLAAIMALTGTAPTGASRSVVSGVTLSGVAGTTIPQYSQASTAAGDVFQSRTAATLDATGNATVDFESVEYGPIPAIAGALNVVTSAVLGWETVINPTGAVLGAEQQSDASARAARRNMLGAQGTALVVAITSALYAVTGVRSLICYENYTGTDATIDSRPVVAHSIRVCVDGGADADVAAALLAHKSIGAGWNGYVSVDVVEPASGQTYTVLFDRPELVPVKIRATVAASSLLSDPVTTIKNAILAFASGQQDGEAGFVVGASVSPFEISGSISRAYPGTYISNMEVAKDDGSAFGNAPVVLTRWQQATVTAAEITVVVTT